MPTARNARGIDIIAYNKNGTRFIGVQVKALSTCSSWQQYREGNG